MNQSTRNHTPVAVMPASDDVAIVKIYWIIIIGLLLPICWIVVGLSTVPVPAVRAAIIFIRIWTHWECSVRVMASMLFFCSKKDKPKCQQQHKLVERNLLSLVQTHSTPSDTDQLRHRINTWLRESSDASRRHDWGLFSCCICLQPQDFSDFDAPGSGLRDWLPRRDSDVSTE